MKPLLYLCPHCRTELHVAPDLIGETITCSNSKCGMPFKAEVPRAQPTPELESHAQDRDPKNLVTLPSDTEETLHKIHPAMLRNHPWYYLGCVALGLVGAFLLVAPYLDPPPSGWGGLPIGGPALVIAGWICLGACALLFVGWWIQTRFVTLSITTKRSIYQSGIVARETSEVQHDDVRNISIDQSFFQRLLGVGTLKLSSSGQDDFEIVARGIPSPDSLTRIIRENQ